MKPLRPVPFNVSDPWDPPHWVLREPVSAEAGVNQRIEYLECVLKTGVDPLDLLQVPRGRHSEPAWKLWFSRGPLAKVGRPILQRGMSDHTGKVPASLLPKYVTLFANSLPHSEIPENGIWKGRIAKTDDYTPERRATLTKKRAKDRLKLYATARARLAALEVPRG